MNKRRGEYAGQLPKAKSGRGAHSASLEGRMTRQDEAKRRQQIIAEMMAKRLRGSKKSKEDSNEDASAD
ncbi:hypothetical protein QLQ12_32435 [Actinoplanes sp. NEAU-A12]|uniref:Uncharacterized protein n=1 Tax=Actinoplanes sandaracinus TaxID=3045177 RepID=A0ABT6WUB2_9ACTN|nr:hypothetical protein [Actinoplanes sandaracinus]MDI6103327.1 hypothetical protein [Actinoplanes sandaracinus]